MTVGPGITPGLLTLLSGTAEAVLPSSARGLCALRAITAGGELHPALRTFLPPECLAAQRFYHIFAVCAWPIPVNQGVEPVGAGLLAKTV